MKDASALQSRREKVISQRAGFEQRDSCFFKGEEEEEEEEEEEGEEEEDEEEEDVRNVLFLFVCLFRR